MGSKSKKGKDKNYMNMQSYRNALYVKTNVALAKNIEVGSLVEVTEQEALRYGGGIPATCIDVYFDDMPPLRLTDNALDITHDTKTYKATPDLQNVDAHKQTNQINSSGGRVRLSAIDDTFIQLIHAKKTTRARITVSIAMVDKNNKCLAMFIEHRGFIKVPSVSFEPKFSQYEIEFETTNFFEMLDQIPGTKPADAVQQSIWPGDTAFTHTTVDEDEEWKVKN